jgi:Kef-type K+ transport system membrane component KefB
VPVRRPALRSLGTLVLVLVVYFAVPVKRLGTDWSAVASVVGLLLGIVLLAWLITGQVRRHMRADADHAVRIQSLLMLLYLAVLLTIWSGLDYAFRAGRLSRAARNATTEGTT